MAKIFLSFFNGIEKNDNKEHKIPAFYESFIDGFSKSGNDIFVYYHNHWNKDFENIPEDLLEDLEIFNPDLIILFNNSFYDISKYFDCPILIYEVDSPIYYSNKDKIKENPNRYKYFIASSNNEDFICEKFKVLKENIFRIPFFTSIKSENILQTTNISFIGTFFHYSDFIRNFILDNPDKKDIEQFQQIFLYVKKFPFSTKEDLIKKFNISSCKIIEHLNVSKIVDFLSSSQRFKTLSGIADLGLDLYGTKTWLTQFDFYPEIAFSFNNKQIASLKEQQDIYNSSKLSISIAHAQAVNGFPWRICDIMASNACLVTDYHSDFEIYFPNIKIPIFSNPYEARELCQKLLREDNMRKDIVFSCQEIINKNFRFDNLLEIMQEKLNLKLKTENLASIKFYDLYKIKDKKEEITVIFECKNTINDKLECGIKLENKKNNCIQKLKIKKRFRMFGYLFFLMLAQIPIIDLFLRKNMREKFLKKIHKHWR